MAKNKQKSERQYRARSLFKPEYEYGLGGIDLPSKMYSKLKKMLQSDYSNHTDHRFKLTD